MKKILFIIAVLSLTAFIKGPDGEIKTDMISSRIEKMTLDEKIGQLFIIRPDCLDPEYISDDKNPAYKVFTEVTEGMRETYKKYPAGGFALFSKNIVDEEQMISFNEQLHSLNELIPVIGVDEEGGSVSRIANNENFDVPRYSSMEDVAEKNDPDYTYMAGYNIGSYLSDLGFDLDFAPVADVNTNPKNKVIGERAFGSDPYTASVMVQDFIFGMHEKNIMTCIKHFPGHGDTSGDSHVGFTYTDKTWEEMKECEMISFIGGIKADTDMIMVAHIAAPEVTGTDTIATFSYTLITDKLRNELGYNGVIITDSMEMGAIVDNYEADEAAIRASKAGADISLLPQEYTKACEGLKEAVLSGEISEERINESVYRILTLKQKHFRPERGQIVTFKDNDEERKKDR